MAPVVENLGWKFAPLPCSPTDVAFLIVALLVALLAPNTEEIFRLAQRARASEVAPPLWRLSRGWSTACALTFVVALLHLTGVTEFLYFQF
jgi:alginate O-acetyltransferase complex protein AlgI